MNSNTKRKLKAFAFRIILLLPLKTKLNKKNSSDFSALSLAFTMKTDIPCGLCLYYYSIWKKNFTNFLSYKEIKTWENANVTFCSLSSHSLLSVFILVGSVMFGATFNLVTCVRLPSFLEHWKIVGPIWKLAFHHIKQFNVKFTAKIEFSIGQFMLPLLTLTLEV